MSKLQQPKSDLLNINLAESALLLIDIQMAFALRDETGVSRSNPDAEANITKLLRDCRKHGMTIMHIHHHSLDPNSPFRATSPGSLVQAFAAPLADEAVFIKHVNSAFIGTSLEKDLHASNINNLLLCGATANHCLETTARMAGNLGFNTLFLSDCVWAYSAQGPDGIEHSAEQIHSVTLANLHREFAQVIKSSDALSLLTD